MSKITLSPSLVTRKIKSTSSNKSFSDALAKPMIFY